MVWNVLEVQKQGNEPNDIANHHPDVLEGGQQQIVGMLRLCAHEFLQLHLGPEMGEMEAQQTQDEDTQDGHVLGAPAIVLGLGGNLIALDAAAAGIVLDGKPDTVADMEDESQSQDGNHDGDDRGSHEVAAQLEPAVSVGEGEAVSRYLAEVPVQGIDHGEKVNGAMQKQEDYKESAGYALDELLADRRG